jgi:TolB-like protein
MQRRLAAILAADVVGFSRLMEVDEAGTLAALKSRRRGVLEPLVARHQGRVFKVTGDGVLVEFASAVNAVQCAVDLQQAFADANKELPEERQIVLRIGVNLGDVMVEGSDLYGDGVNIAARLEALAEPGGILVASTAHDHLGTKVKIAFEDIGVQTLKNIAQPVRAHRVTGMPAVSIAAPKPLSDKPSIAVLPFTNISGDPEQEYFSDGITEDIITELSRFDGLSVIARNSSFQFKGKAVDVKEVGRKLGARFIVEGSVRKLGNRVRITTQLIEAATGNHLWAERYDRDLAELFAVQDEVVQAISAAIPGQIDRAAVAQIRKQPTANLTAYDCELRGRWAFLHLADGLSVALDWYKQAVAADAGYALAHAGLGMTYMFGILSLGLSPEEARALGIQHARQAVILDEGNCKVNACAAYTYHIAGEHKLARKHAERAVALNPNDPFALYAMGCALSYTGEPEKAIEWIMNSARLDPFAPDDQRLDTLCDCYYMLHDYAKLLEIRETYQNVPAFLQIVLAAALGQVGRLEDARAAVSEYERTKPTGHDLQALIKNWMRMCLRTEDREHWLDGFRKAGIDV